MVWSRVFHATRLTRVATRSTFAQLRHIALTNRDLIFLPITARAFAAVLEMLLMTGRRTMTSINCSDSADSRAPACAVFPRYNTALVQDLIPYVNNARTHSETQVAQIALLLGAQARAHEILYSTRILKKTGLRLSAKTGNSKLNG